MNNTNNQQNATPIILPSVDLNPKKKGFSGELSFCSNFYHATLKFKEIDFHTAEHAYQWAKCKNQLDKNEILKSTNPVDAKKIGRHAEMVDNWDNIKIQTMYEILKAKFNNLYLAERLIKTENQELVEHNYWKDYYWGVCDGKGENWLGRLLMKIREELKQEKTIHSSDSIKFNIKILEHEKQKLETQYKNSLKKINSDILSIQKSCKHQDREYFPDPSGNSDSFEECKICGAQDKRL